MSEPEPLTPELKGLEASLAALAPQAATINRDQLMYEAGRSAQPQRHGAWSAALVGCAALALGVGRWTAPTLQVEPQAPIAVAPTPSIHADADATARLADPASYFQLRRHWGDVDLAAAVSPPPSGAARNTADRNTLLRELLN